MNFHLVDAIENDRENKNLADRAPTFPNELTARFVSRKHGPEIRGLPSSCVFDSVDDPQNSCHQWLEDEPEMKGAVQASNKILENSFQDSHASSPPTVCDLPRQTAFDFERNGPAQKRPHQNQQTQRHDPLPGEVDRYRLHNVRSNQEFQPELQRFSNEDFQLQIGVR